MIRHSIESSNSNSKNHDQGRGFVTVRCKLYCLKHYYKMLMITAMKIIHNVAIVL